MTITIQKSTVNNATDLDAGQVVTITLQTDTPPFTVNGIPELALNNNEVGTYSGGSGTDTLTFTYTVQPGDDIADLQILGLNFPNGASIDNGGSNLTSLTGDLALQVDTTAPSLVPDPVYITIVDPSATNATNANGINNLGQIVGNYYDASFTSHGFIQDGGIFTSIDNPLAAQGDPNVSQGTVLNGINDAGQVAGYYYDVSGIGHGFVYDSGNFTAIEDPSAANGTYAFGINSNGDVVGYYVDAGHVNHGFVYSGGSYTTLDDPSAAGGSTFAFGINDSGQVVGYYYDTNSIAHGFVYSNGVYTTIDDPSAAGGTFAFGINNAGEIVGNFVDSNFRSHGFIDSGGNFTTIDNPAGTDTAPTGINTAGKIVGAYFDSVTGYGFSLDASTIPITPVLTNPVGGSENPGQTVSFTVSMTEGVVVSGGTPTLTLNSGGTAIYDPTATAALNDATKLVFDYTVGVSDTHVSTLAITGLNLNGATIQDLAGNNADMSAVDITFNDLSVICFMPGTLISTPGGASAVEALARGDLVLTSDGRALPVRWIGRQTISTRFGDPLRVLPVRIRAGAIDENVPTKDLLLSPDHAILVGDVLVSAGALVNGTSIVRESDVPEIFTYYHVELDDHALVLAHNVPSETFIDYVNRRGFDNWREHEALYPQGKPIAELPYASAKASRQVPPTILDTLTERGLALYGRQGFAAA